MAHRLTLQIVPHYALKSVSTVKRVLPDGIERNIRIFIYVHKNDVNGFQNPLFAVGYKILHRGDKLLAKALRPQRPKHVTIC